MKDLSLAVGSGLRAPTPASSVHAPPPPKQSRVVTVEYPLEARDLQALADEPVLSFIRLTVKRTRQIRISQMTDSQKS